MPKGVPANGKKNPALFVKGERRIGRAKGGTNKTTKQMKEALIIAAGLSKHSETDDLTGYLVYLANDRPMIFGSLLGRLIPEQAKVTVEHNTTTNTNLNVNMPLNDMITAFEQRLKAALPPRLVVDNTKQPLTIEHDPIA